MTPRIIIAHGFGSSAKIAKEEQTNNIRKAFESEGYLVEYVQAPLKVTLEDFPFPAIRDPSKVDLYSWYGIKEGSDASLAKAEEVIKNLNNETNPIVGFVGLSQGGAISSLVAANYKRWIPSLKFAIAYGGFYYPTPRSDPPADLSAYDGKIEIPFLTVVGEQDTVVTPEISSILANNQVAAGKSTILRHGGGHVFADDSETIQKVLDWIKSV